MLEIPRSTARWCYAGALATLALGASACPVAENSNAPAPRSEAPLTSSIGGLPALNIDMANTSVSGLSSGAFMAVQFHVAYSSIMRGAAVFAGGPYYCAQGSLSTALGACTTASPSSPDPAAAESATRSNASAGTIDDPANLSAQRVFLFGGADDTTVAPPVMDALNSDYKDGITSGDVH